MKNLINASKKSCFQGEKKISLSVSVKPATKDYLTSHKVKGGEVLDDYVESRQD